MRSMRQAITQRYPLTQYYNLLFLLLINSTFNLIGSPFFVSLGGLGG